MSPRLLRLGLGVVTGLLATFAYFGVRGPGPDPSGAAASEAFLDPPIPAPPLALLDPDGRTVRLDEFRGRTVALFFGYARCPDICPITVAQLARLRTELDPGGDRLQIVFVSLDPARDDGATLSRWAEAFAADVVALTGPLDTLRAQALEWGVGFVYRPRDGGPVDSVLPRPGGALGDDYLVDHTARTFVVDAAGRLVAQVPTEARPERLRRVLERVLVGR